jgi:hypothetical protein
MFSVSRGVLAYGENVVLVLSSSFGRGQDFVEHVLDFGGNTEYSVP